MFGSRLLCSPTVEEKSGKFNPYNANEIELVYETGEKANSESKSLDAIALSHDSVLLP